MAKNVDLEKVLLDYAHGEKSADETNEALKEMGSTLTLDPSLNVITAEEMADTTISGDLKTINGYVYVELGVGDPEKVRVIDSVLQGCDMGEQYAQAIVGPLWWEIKGDKIADFGGICKKKYEFNK